MLRTLFVLLILAFWSPPCSPGSLRCHAVVSLRRLFSPRATGCGVGSSRVPAAVFLPRRTSPLPGVALSGQLRVGRPSRPRRRSCPAQFTLRRARRMTETGPGPFWVDFAKSSAITWLVASVVTDVNRFRQVLLVMSRLAWVRRGETGLGDVLCAPGREEFQRHSKSGRYHIPRPSGCWCSTRLFVALARTAQPSS